MSNNLQLAIAFIEALVRQRISSDLKHKSGKRWTSKEPDLPDLNPDENSAFTRFIYEYQIKGDEMVILMLALIPHILPHFFDSIIAEFLPAGNEFPAFGAIRNQSNKTAIPSGETALYLIAGNDLEHRLQLRELFAQEHLFAQNNVIHLGAVHHGESYLNGPLLLDEEYVELFTKGMAGAPKLSTNFPAQYISTQLEWSDLVLHPQTQEQIQDLEIWIKNNHVLMNGWGLSAKLKPGYRALFYGPPGTGKTLTATLLGKYTQRKVFRIDLSMVISKYIGETEKNLSSLFEKAANKDWILFFDEADALFGKRTNVRDAHDKYANQEVAYLLQKIELYNGLAILASNFKDNIDDAFIRRFNAVVYFPKPQAEQRLQLWKNSIPDKIKLSDEINLYQVAKDFDLTGSHIINIVQYICLYAIENQSEQIDKALLLKGIQMEMAKEGKRLEARF